MEKLPALVKARAMGGSTGNVPASTQRSYAKTLTALANPEDTFGLLRTVLEGLGRRLSLVRRTVERRNALAAATPSIWPAHGWLSSAMGSRVDPVTGGCGLPRRPRHRRRPRPARLRHRRRHGGLRRLSRQLRQPDRHRPRLRPRDPLRSPAVVQRDQGRQGASAATSSAASAPPGAPPATTSTTRCWPTATCSIRSSSSPAEAARPVAGLAPALHPCRLSPPVATIGRYSRQCLRSQTA